MGDGPSDALWSTSSSPSFSFVVWVGTLLKFLDQWRSIISNRLVLNLVKGYHLQLRYHPPLFHNFRCFNIKAATTHRPIIQEMDELLAKGATDW